MKFFAIPDPRKGAVTKEMLADLKAAGILPGNIGAFASEQHWIEATQVGAPVDGIGAKFWRDNATIYGAWRESYDYLMIGRNADGGVSKLDLRAASAFSDGTFNYYMQSTANFYRQYIQHFPLIPRLVRRTLTRYDARRMNFGPGVPEDYPLGIFLSDPDSDNPTPTFPSNMALRFHPQTGQVEAFYWEEYVREFPFDWTPRVPPVSAQPKLSDLELVDAVTDVIDSRLLVRDKATAIRQLAAL